MVRSQKNRRIKVKLHNKGFAKLRNSPEVLAELDRRAQKIAAAAGEGFEATPAKANHGGAAPRGRATVGTTNYESRRKNAKENTLNQALWAGKG